MTREEIESEIREKRQLLRQTDCETLKAVESFFTATASATGIVDFLKALKESVADFTATFRSRAEWRARVYELEATVPEDSDAGEVA